MRKIVDRPIRQLVRRIGAERYILIVLLCLSASVSLTRFFLELSDYPQLGNAELHFAHVLWGGLFLMVAALLPLLFANRRVLNLSAIFAGIGMGLFIDEVGKFITQSNDYFYPAAAPIVYAFFLITLWIYMMVRSHRKQNARSMLYEVLALLEEYLDRDLSDVEKKRVLDLIDQAQALDANHEYVALFSSIQDFIHSEQVHLVEHHADFFDRLKGKCEKFEQKHLPQKTFRRLVMTAMILWGVIAIIYPFLSITFSNDHAILSGLWAELINTQLPLLSESSILLLLRLIGEVMVGILLLGSAFLIRIGKEIPAIRIAYTTLLVSISGIYMLVFYYDQFSAIVFVLLQFVVFGLVARYRKRFVLPAQIEEIS
ncbi:MAG TPA: hypothetical protein DCK95_06335 [Anaerolineaceae bacterium]|nr:hypothetical protein [Anaerolineaceae bacterium]